MTQNSRGKGQAQAEIFSVAFMKDSEALPALFFAGLSMNQFNSSIYKAIAQGRHEKKRSNVLRNPYK